jgi:hypothetical protein
MNEHKSACKNAQTLYNISGLLTMTKNVLDSEVKPETSHALSSIGDAESALREGYFTLHHMWSEEA